MKKIISALILSSFLLACSDEITLTPGISFLTPDPEVFEETAIFRVIGQPFSTVDSLTVPVTFGGTAQLGTDYEVSSDSFVLTKDSLTDSIVVYTKQLGTGKSVNLALQIPEGFVAGKYQSSGLKLQDKYGFLNFESARSFAADTAHYSISVCDSSGMAKALSTAAEIHFEVNAEKSTAVEGVDYKFINTEELTIAAGTGYTYVSLVTLGDGPREGHDRIVLNLVADSKFGTGLLDEMEITIADPVLKSLDGHWIMESINTEASYFEEFWGNACSNYDLLPQFNSSDLVEFSFQRASFSPLFMSDFRNFFIADSAIGQGSKMDIIDIEGNPKSILLLSLDRTNRYFSADQSSEDSVSFIGIYAYQNPDTQADMMELYILDHTSKSFMPELESGMKYAAEKPVAATPGLYICTTFRRY